jgi:hypothetical protein
LKNCFESGRNNFDQLLNVQFEDTANGETTPIASAPNDFNINTEPFSLEESRLAVEELKNGKSPGCDYSVPYRWQQKFTTRFSLTG